MKAIVRSEDLKATKILNITPFTVSFVHKFVTIKFIMPTFSHTGSSAKK